MCYWPLGQVTLGKEIEISMGFIWFSKGEIRNNNLKISSKIVNKSHKAMCAMQKGSQANRDKKKKADFPESCWPLTSIVILWHGCFRHFPTKQGRKENKRHGLIFTCLSLRAEDLTNDAFINVIREALREIKSRDNILGGKNEHLNKDRMAAHIAVKQWDFTMNVPGTCHMEGVWNSSLGW